jgi:hypothetical protein
MSTVYLFSSLGQVKMTIYVAPYQCRYVLIRAHAHTPIAVTPMHVTKNTEGALHCVQV